jgi:WD40 repeat protein
MRRIDELEANPIPGTEGGIAPFLSPDDRWLGFWAGGRLKKVPVEGGIAQDLCEADRYGASWGVNDRIVFCDFANLGLSTISASGGNPEVLTIPDKDRDEGDYRLPSCLPDNRGILFTVTRLRKGSVVDLNPRVDLFDARTGERRVLIEDASDAGYIPTGHIVFMRRGEIWAVPFSLRNLEATGPPGPIRSDVMQALNPTSRNSTAGQFSISESGCLIFAPGGVPPPWVNSLAWVDREGNDEPAGSQFDQHYIPRLSPDGTKIAFQTLFTREQVWIHDTQREMSYPLVSEGISSCPIWTPDGDRIIYRKTLPDRSGGIFSRSAGGIDSTEELLYSFPAGSDYYPSSVSPDGKRLALLGGEMGQSQDIHIFDFESRSCAPFRITPHYELCPSFSPDGRWIVYSSIREGQEEVYVSPSDGSGGSIKVSIDGGHEPNWARSGREIFYRSYVNTPSANYSQMWAVDVRAGTEFSAGRPRLLFESPKYGVAGHVPCWDISLDDRRFLMVRRDDRPLKPVTEMILIQDWFAEVRRLVPTGKQ